MTPKLFAAVILAFFGLLPAASQAVTPPASVAGMVFTVYPYHAVRQTFLQSNGSCYDVKNFSYGVELPMPLQVGTYTYQANPDNTATLVMNVATSDGAPQSISFTLTFDTATSGSFPTIGGPTYNGQFTLTPLVDGGYFNNISSRSLVAPGTPCIAGFIVGGTTPRMFLIRVVGPTLAQYGVADAVADPSLQLFKGSTLLATNDDWGTKAPINTTGLASAFTPGTPADLSNAFTQAAAFPLSPGSKDAALLVVLQPGLYSVMGRASQTGELLVEVYLVP